MMAANLALLLEVDGDVLDERAQLDIAAVGRFLVAIGDHLDIADDRLFIAGRNGLVQRQQLGTGRHQERRTGPCRAAYADSARGCTCGVPTNMGLGRSIASGSIATPRRDGFLDLGGGLDDFLFDLGGGFLDFTGRIADRFHGRRGRAFFSRSSRRFIRFIGSLAGLHAGPKHRATRSNAKEITLTTELKFLIAISSNSKTQKLPSCTWLSAARLARARRLKRLW